jgi:hypothetical protein
VGPPDHNHFSHRKEWNEALWYQAPDLEAALPPDWSWLPPVPL